MWDEVLLIRKLFFLEVKSYDQPSDFHISTFIYIYNIFFLFSFYIFSFSVYFCANHSATCATACHYLLKLLVNKTQIGPPNPISLSPYKFLWIPRHTSVKKVRLNAGEMNKKRILSSNLNAEVLK